MAFVQFSKVSLAFGDRDILKDVSLNLALGTRAALAGANGAGKSTLLKVIAGKIVADSGDRSVQKGCRISYLPQSGIVHCGRTLREEAETAYENIQLLFAKMEELGKELEKSPGENSRTKSLLLEHQKLHEEIENSGYYRRDALLTQVLLGLGFSQGDLDRETSEFSSGWQMRIALAKVLLENPGIMLLDEPTNYLDIEARSWLESWLASFPGGCLLVSHDRYFLDVTVNEVYEIFQGNLKRYAGNYSVYEKTRAAELESLVRRYKAQQEEIEKTESLIRRFRYKASKAAFAQDLIRRLEKMERIEIPEHLKKISVRFPLPPHSGRIALTLEGISKSYGQRLLIRGLDLDLQAGERLIVAGQNGAGKTTLLRIIAGEDADYEGNVKYGAGISVGYFSQEEAETISGSMTVLQYIEADTPTYLIPKVRDMLGAFLFRGDDVFKALSVLSGGEKSRLALLRMLLRPINLLVLDEPTNHLDLQSKDILLDCLEVFKGTIIFVSHDRSFMEALSTKTLELQSYPVKPESRYPALTESRCRLFYGNYAYYLDRIEREASGEILGENVAPLPKTTLGKAGGQPSVNAAEPTGGSQMRVSRAQEKLHKALVRRLERKEEEILKVMEELEGEKFLREEELTKPEVYSSGEKARETKLRLDEICLALEERTREWEAVAGELAGLVKPG